MKCKTCDNDNPDDHQYCGYCGSHLQEQAPAPRGQPWTALQEAAVEGLKAKLDKIEYDASCRIKEEALGWAKGLMKLYGATLVILLAALGLFGIKQFSDLKETLENIQVRMSRLEQNVEDKTNELLENLDNQIKEAAGQLAELKSGIGALNLDVNKEKQNLAVLRDEASKLNYAQEIDRLRQTIAQKMEEVNRLSKRLDEGIGKIRQIKDDLTKVDHALFDINVQFDAGADQPQGSLETYLLPLTEKGFIIEEANVLRISVNKSEVIYYNHQARIQARLISDTLKSDFPTITTRFFDRKEKNSREILIKLTRH